MQDFYEVKDNQIWLNSFLDFESRMVHEGFTSLDETLEVLDAAYKKFMGKVEGVLIKVEATQNKGSYLVQLQNFKKQILEINAIGDFTKVYQRIEGLEKEILVTIEQNRSRNLEIKKALLEEIEIVSASTIWKKAGEEMNSIRLRWKKTGAASADLDDQLETKFQSYTDHFYNARSAFFEKSESAISLYSALISESTAIIEDEKFNRNQKISELKKVQVKWKSLPPIPKNKYSDLYKSFNNVHDDFFSGYKSEVEKEKAERKVERTEQGLQKKRALILKVKALQKNLPENYMNEIKALRTEWKNSGYVPNALSDEIWAEFNYWIERLIENSRLEKMVRENSELNLSNEKEVISEKLKHLKRLVRKEKESLEKMNSNIGSFRINHKSKGFGQLLDSKAKEQERRWQVKRDIIRELEAELVS